MSHAPHNRLNVQSAASLQFSLRGLLLAILVAAMFCALLAPILRPWAGTQQAIFTMILAGALLLDALAIAGLFWRRRCIEHAAGSLLLRAESHWGERARAAFSFVIVVVFLALMVMWSVLLTRTLERQEMSVLIPLGGAAVTLVSIPPVVFYVWLGVGAWSLELRQEGVIHHGLQYIPWRAAVQFDWAPGDSPRLRVGTPTNDYLLDVPASQQQTLEKILVECTGRLVRPAKVHP